MLACLTGLFRFVALGGILLFGASAGAVAQGVLEDCATDIAAFCAQVEPGHGRVISCLYANEDKLSEACYAANSDVHDAMDFMFATVRNALATCAADIENTCAGTEFGHGRILTCLKENRSEISPQCEQVVNGFSFGLEPN